MSAPLPLKESTSATLKNHLLLVITIAALWSHEVVGALGLADFVVLLLLVELADSEVSQLSLEVLSDEDVLGLDISVNHIVAVH
jgi:hypothetical protein